MTDSIDNILVVGETDDNVIDRYRLPKFVEQYEPSTKTVDFSECETLDEIIILLGELCDENLHLVGTRGYVYSSVGMMSYVNEIRGIDPNFVTESKVTILTRTANLRQAVVNIVLNMRD